MRKLILIKHARPEVDPQVPSEAWRLGNDGRAAAARLADRLRDCRFRRLHASTEPKAAETAQILARSMDLSVEEMPDLREHDRRNVPHMESREFISLVALFFSQPGRLVMGNETADQAYDRFADAVDAIIEREEGDVGIVTHGTVISLFAQRRAGLEPFGLWRRMGLPSFLVLETPTWRVLDVCETV